MGYALTDIKSLQDLVVRAVVLVRYHVLKGLD
jgi:hypothetical protein